MYKRLQMAFVASVLLVTVGMPADADLFCDTGAADDDLLFDQASQAIAAGRDAEGFAMFKKITSACFDSGDAKAKALRFDAATVAVGSKLAKAAESTGKFDDALGFYFDIRNVTSAYTESDEDRVVMANARANKSNRNAVGRALSRFNDEEIERWSSGSHRDLAKPHVAKRASEMRAYGAEARAIATGQGDAAMAAEEKAFQGRGGVGVVFGGYTQSNIEEAKAWYGMVGFSTGIARANERAVARGDQLLKEDAESILQVALDYFTEAGAVAKAQQVRAKAKVLGDAAAARDQYERAAEYYELAGMSERADAVMAAGEEKAEAAESQRQEEFQSGMDDLEKELGF